MYQNLFYDAKKQKVHIWDDGSGYYTIPYKRYAYVRDRAGTHVSLYGDKLRKVFKFDAETPNLFESDVPPETRVLVDQYMDSEELSTDHNIMMILHFHHLAPYKEALYSLYNMSLDRPHYQLKDTRL